MQIRTVRPEDAAAWERLRDALWPPTIGSGHAEDIARFFRGEWHSPAEIFLAIDDRGEPIGFAEASIRPYAEDCYSGRVAFLEGWYVDDAHRQRGVGAALVRAVEDWGRAMDCTEFASDALIDNTLGIAAHRALGFEEVERIVCFRKDL